MDGIIIINKPIGYTSNQVVSKVKKELNEKKVGHTGTLDPLATGVLPILVGKATKLSKFLIEHDKKYIAKIFLGEKKDTSDGEGKTIEVKAVPSLNKKQIEEVLNSFKGNQTQIPPMYSAIKVNGKKLYEYARQGIEIERKERNIIIYDINLLEFKENEIRFEVYCSKGTYIRTLCEDIAGKLGTVGYMSFLERTEVNEFKIENSIGIEEIKKEKIITIEQYFSKNESIKLNEKKLLQFLNGVKLTYNLKEGLYKIYNEKNEFIGIGKIQNNILKREIIL